MNPQNALTEAELNVLMEGSMLRTLQESHSARPAGTTAQYQPKIEEFKQWCEQKEFPVATRYTVTEAKLHLFLEQCVIGRKRKKRWKTGDEIVGQQTVSAYVAAIVDLYQQQKSANINSNDHPRGRSIKSLIRNLSLKTEAIRKTNYVDRGKGTLLDVISSVEDLKQIASYFTGTNSKSDLRNKAMFLLCHFCMMRGEDSRALELPDLFCIAQRTDFDQDCLTLVAVLRQGKTNHFGNRLMAGCMRNRDYEICPLGALGFYMFYR
jgi:hypothetical protein